MKICRFIFSAILLINLHGCTTNTQNNQPTIVTTTGIIGDCIAELVGDQANVISIMGPGVDPHLYRASQGDIEKLSKADIIIYNGLHLEGKMAQMLQKLAKQKPVFAIGDYIEDRYLKRVDKTSDLHDPHIWFDPTVWLKGLEGIAQELDKQKGLNQVAAQFKIYETKILQTQKMLQDTLDKHLDNNTRILITSHDAFEYFGDAFNFIVRGLQGVSTSAEYGTKDVKDLTDFIIDHQVRSIFVESSVSNKNLEAVVASAQARGYTINIGGTLFSDALGDKNTLPGTYEGMLIANVNTILEGLKE